MKLTIATLPRMLAGVTIALAAFGGQAYAAACVTTASVVASAVVVDNVDYNGHVGAHVNGVGTTGRTTSSAGRTVYNSTADFDTVWGKLASINTADCADPIGTNPNVVVVRMTAVEAGTAAVDGYDCQTVDVTEVSKCTAVTGQFTPSNYYFQFQYKNTSPKLAGSNWVLNTAYPEQ